MWFFFLRSMKTAMLRLLKPQPRGNQELILGSRWWWTRKEAQPRDYEVHAAQAGGSSTANLLQALEEYLPVLLGLVKERGSELRNKVQFVWSNQEDDAEETSMADAWYEVLSMLHLMAMVCFLQANSLLLPRSYSDGYGPRVSEESRRATVDVFLKAAGFLDCAVNQVLLQIPPEKRRALPVDLAEGNLKALSLQGLGQGVDMQLGLAIDNPKATLAVKRRLACELVKYWQQIKDSIPELPLSDGWAKKKAHTICKVEVC
ncbi:uncharacterized protein [Lolium perenne]|uniref:uncharacterized protein n=1 Tax=Lolium perenne TaxID=4522 RepID=UPI003A995C1F